MLETTGGFASLRTNLAKIRFTHFVPEEDSARPKRMPLSLYVESSAVRYADADPVPPDGIGEAAFNVDWKKEQEDLAYKQHSWPQVKKELRVRTAIEGEKRKSEDEKLFAIRLVLPGEYVWSGVLDLPKSVEAERPAIIGQLRGLLQNEIWGIGKTKAAATVEISEVKAGDGPPPLAKDTSVRVVLQTPALLLNPDEIGHDTTPEDLLTLYQAAFGEGGGLKLVNFFHDLRLDGGDYLYGRFRKGKQYKPYLLTTPGSTFVFTVTDETNAEDARELVQPRLPILAGCKNLLRPRALKTATEDLWQYCPGVPENGLAKSAESMVAVTLYREPDQLQFKPRYRIKGVLTAATKPTSAMEEPRPIVSQGEGKKTARYRSRIQHHMHRPYGQALHSRLNPQRRHQRKVEELRAGWRSAAGTARRGTGRRARQRRQTAFPQRSSQEGIQAWGRSPILV